MSRSDNMRAIRSKDMLPKLTVRLLVHRLGYPLPAAQESPLERGGITPNKVAAIQWAHFRAST
jgi:G:T-mismatch repair DNA endonuclease (very short patch repair protein)